MSIASENGGVRESRETRELREQREHVHGRMGFDEREVLMIYLLRHAGVFSEARQVLTPSHFTENYEIIWAVCWRAAMDLYDQYGEMPSYVVLEADALRRAESNPDEISVEAVEEMRRFLSHVFEMDTEFISGPYEAYGYDLLQLFLKERHWMDTLRKWVSELGDSTPVNAPDIMQDFQQRLGQVQGMRSNVTECLIPETWDNQSLEIIPHGIQFIDSPMGGGWARGEVYGLLGTFGSGKTMLACQIGAEVAKYFAERLRLTGQPPETVVYVTYETPPDDIRRRIISNIGSIKLTHLNQVPYSETLSRAGRRHLYEEEMFTGDPLGEWERYQSRVMPIRDIVRVTDMRGDSRNPKAGSGWIDEIRSELDKSHRVSGFKPGMILIDYALVCTKRYIRARGLDPDKQLRHLLGSFGDECRRLLAQHFNCGVWIVNQLSGQANKRAPTASMNHADSAEASNFAENLWYAACLGNKDRNTNGVMFDVTKTRRSQGLPTPAIIRLNGDMAKFESADGQLIVDRNLHRLVPQRYGQMIAPTYESDGTTVAPRTRASANPAAAMSPSRQRRGSS